MRERVERVPIFGQGWWVPLVIVIQATSLFRALTPGGFADGGPQVVVMLSVTSGAVLVSLLWRLRGVEHKVAWVRRNWHFLVCIVVPMATPFLLAAAYIGRLDFESWFVPYLSIVVIFVVGAAVLALWFEQDAEGSKITDFGDAVWWAIVTTTTVGYGDVVPVTPEGQWVAVFLMLLAITMVGAITANVSSYVQREAGRRRDDSPEHLLERLSTRLRRLEAQLDSISHAVGAEVPPVEDRISPEPEETR